MVIIKSRRILIIYNIYILIIACSILYNNNLVCQRGAWVIVLLYLIILRVVIGLLEKSFILLKYFKVY